MAMMNSEIWSEEEPDEGRLSRDDLLPLVSGSITVSNENIKPENLASAFILNQGGALEEPIMYMSAIVRLCKDSIQGI